MKSHKVGASVFVAVLAVSAMLIALAGSALATDGPPGNNGTIKIHEQGTPSGTERNDPKVCVFNVEGFGFDVGQTGYIMFDVQGGDAPTGTNSGPHNFGPTTESEEHLSFYATEYFNLDPGHYKATLYGKDTGGGINLQDEKAKSKVFKVECAVPSNPPSSPPSTPPVQPTPTPAGTSGGETATPAPNAGETDTPTLPPTNTIESPAQSGGNLPAVLLVLLAMSSIAIGATVLRPRPIRTRR